MTKVTIWEQYFEHGLHVFPVSMPSKVPAISKGESWKVKNPNWVFNEAGGLACGMASGGVECLDIDAKNDSSLFERLEKKLIEYNVVLPDNFVFQKTPNGGAHFIFRSEKVEGNQVLAKSKKGDVLIETRGEGGYVCITPTPGYEITQGDLFDIPFFTDEQRDNLFSACRSLNEYWHEVKEPYFKQNRSNNELLPWDDFNLHGNIPELLESHGWSFLKSVGENDHYCRPDKSPKSTSATWNESKRLFYVFTSSTLFESGKAYTASAVFTYLECNQNFSESAKQLIAKGYGTKKGVNETKVPTKSFKDYIIKNEPEEEKGIIFIGGVCILSEGNVLLLTGPMKGRKTMLASVLVNQCKLKTAYIDTEQGRRHSWRTGTFTPSADVFHMRGEDQGEIMRVVNECVHCGEYELIVLDNVRDLLKDFNNVEQSGEIELFLKKISEKVPVIAILHENKNSNKGQGHVGHGLNKIAQTAIRVQLVDIEDPAKGSFVECVHTRDEPFKRAFLSMEGILSNDNLLKAGGKTMLQEEFFRMLGDVEYSYDELLDRIAEIFGIMKSSAKNAFTTIRRACPNAITERKEGKRKIYFVSLSPK